MRETAILIAVMAWGVMGLIYLGACWGEDLGGERDDKVD